MGQPMQRPSKHLKLERRRSLARVLQRIEYGKLFTAYSPVRTSGECGHCRRYMTPPNASCFAVHVSSTVYILQEAYRQRSTKASHCTYRSPPRYLLLHDGRKREGTANGSARHQSDGAFDVFPEAGSNKSLRQNLRFSWPWHEREIRQFSYRL